jgi:uncharacterized BrkB/YihY/UPF0761 family membrane protein
MMMRKKILFLILSLVLLLPLNVQAQLVPVANTGAPTVDDVTKIVEAVEKLAGLLFGAVAVICFVLAGILFLTSKGEPEKLKLARSAFFWGVAGVIVGIMAFSIIKLVSALL